MSGSVLEKVVCEGCGANVREGSAFCVGCGRSVVDEPRPPAITMPDPELLNGKRRSDSATIQFRDPEPAPIAIPETKLPAASPDEQRAAFPAAAATRAEKRVRTVKVSEVEWVERTSSSVTFVITAIVLGLLAAGLVAAAIYLR